MTEISNCVKKKKKSKLMKVLRGRCLSASSSLPLVLTGAHSGNAPPLLRSAQLLHSCASLASPMRATLRATPLWIRLTAG